MLSAEWSDILALCVVTTVFGGFVGWVLSKLRRSPFTPFQTMLYAINYIVVRVLWRVKIQGNISKIADQGAIIVCNHRCPLDPSFVAVTVLRAVHWMVAKEYCEHPAFRFLLRTCEVIPVRRGVNDPAATRTAIELARRGELIGLFPEGRINTTDAILSPLRRGAALIALKARVPVVPCFIQGSPYDGTTLGCLLMPASVTLTIGRPIDVSEYADRPDRREAIDALTLRLGAEISRLGGQPDYPVQLARVSARNRNHAK